MGVEVQDREKMSWAVRRPWEVLETKIITAMHVLSSLSIHTL